MNAPALRGLRAAAAPRAALVLRPAPAAPRPAAAAAAAAQTRWASSLPTIVQPAFWKSLVPKPLRRGKDGTLPAANAVANARKAKEWNPATFYIFIFLFIGSMSIQMIALKKDFDTYMRQADVKIGLLREVVERIQKGEDVDVEQVLGTGDPTQEAEWEAVLGEIERDEVSRSPKRQDRKTAEASSPSPPVTPTPSTEPTAAVAASPPTPATRPSLGKVASATSFY